MKTHSPISLLGMILVFNCLAVEHMDTPDPVRDKTEDDTIRNEVINLLLRSEYTNLGVVLVEILQDTSKSPRFRSFTAQHLGTLALRDSTRAREKIILVLRQEMTGKHAVICHEALLALTYVKDPAAHSTIVQWINGEREADGLLRDVAFRCAHEFDLRDQIPAIRKYSEDSNPIVRISALNALGQWMNMESISAFHDAVRSENPQVKEAGAAALARFNSLDRIVLKNEQSIDNLTILLDDALSAVRHQAAKALRTFAGRI